jgi:Cof subfamily protein (haloacid dehalogenase superfamily)
MTQLPTQPNELLVFDLDGTLLDENHQIPKSLRTLLLTLRQSGIEMTLATGRPFAAVRSFIDELELTLPLITFNGAVVITPDGVPLSVHPLPLASAKGILRHIEATSAANHLYLNPADDFFYSDHQWKPDDHLIQKDGLKYRYSPSLLNMLCEVGSDPVKMFSIGPRQELEHVQQWIRQTEPSVSCFFSEHDMIEFLGPAVSKGTALEFLCDAIGRTTKSVIAFGDNMNDLEMLKVAGTGIAMTAAPQELQTTATQVIDNIENYLRNRFKTDLH